jgi:heme/copper-type cytochrome/quinol oxidase subunit 3
MKKFSNNITYKNPQTHRHPFHILEPSPLPFLMSISVLEFALGLILYFHFSNPWVALFGLGSLLVIFTYWMTDIIREATFGGFHTTYVVSNLQLGFKLFILTEIMFFVSFFWAFFHFSLSPSIFIGMQWPPNGIIPVYPWRLPFFNTILLLYSSFLVNMAHKAFGAHMYKEIRIGLRMAIICGIFFLCIQFYEYSVASFSINDSVYGSIFYMLTGCHGLHVFVGTIFLIVAYFRHGLKHFTSEHHVGFDIAALYWHFVDVVWIFVYFFVYIWGGGFSLSSFSVHIMTIAEWREVWKGLVELIKNFLKRSS